MKLSALPCPHDERRTMLPEFPPRLRARSRHPSRYSNDSPHVVPLHYVMQLTPLTQFKRGNETNRGAPAASSLHDWCGVILRPIPLALIVNRGSSSMKTQVLVRLWKPREPSQLFTGTFDKVRPDHVVGTTRTRSNITKRYRFHRDRFR